ncbi:metallophosphoesterase [Legionella sp.]|uniref:metallophosphoesterase n=1 Tax=Legionella sp. TaxID=459 RepID=UPI003CB8A36B
MNLNKETLKIIQITDTHLFKNDSYLFNVDTNLAFKKVMCKIEDDLADTDAIFLTGDLSQDETVESYEIIANSLKNLNKNIFWIPGNHDSICNMQSVFCKEGNFFRERILSTPLWDFFFLNTKIDGKETGFLSNNELLLIHSELKKERKKPIALIMHHHPIEVKTPLIDNYILENKDKFFETIGQSNIDLIICGHVHNDYSLRHGTICIETSPATCFQFKKGSTDLAIENSIGYKVYYFSSNSYVAEAKIWQN